MRSRLKGMAVTDILGTHTLTPCPLVSAMKAMYGYSNAIKVSTRGWITREEH